MATKNLVRHGTAAGYNAEIETGNVCERCRNARRVYQAQFTKRAKAARGGKPPKYGTHDVIDHLYTGRKSAPAPQRTAPAPQADEPRTAVNAPHDERTRTPAADESAPHPQNESDTGPSLRDRLMAGMQRLGNTYVESDEIPDYLTTVEPDPDPDDPDSSKVKGEEFVITQKNMELIEENMGTYLSVVGMSLEIIDPYCGPILADNLDNMVHRWSKVVARYPRAAKLFMSEGGGTLMDWIGAIQATWPVLLAIYEHHLAGTVKTDKGRVYRITPSDNGQTVDSTMPPIPDNYYTVG
jgi:hypothetical protein